MARERDDDYEDDVEDDRPARRSRSGGSSGDKEGGIGGFFSNIVVAIIFAAIGVLCCPCLSIILGGIGIATSKTPEGKKGSTIVLVGGVVGLVIGVILQLTGVAGNLNK